MRDGLAALYGNRHDLFPMLRSVRAPGRPYVAFATDESAPGFYNFNQSPIHILGMRTADAKLGIYANWMGNTAQIDTANGLELEYYDYGTEAGRLELVSDPSSPQAMEMARQLLTEILPNELRAPLPPPLRIPQALTPGSIWPMPSSSRTTRRRTTRPCRCRVRWASARSSDRGGR